MKARFKSNCFLCYRAIDPGSEIRKSRSGKFVHDRCGKIAEMNAAITAGLTFRSGRASEWRLGQSPSSRSRRLA